MTYQELWDTYVEPNLPPEVDPEGERAEAEANAIAAALTVGADIRPLMEAFGKSRP